MAITRSSGAADTAPKHRILIKFEMQNEQRQNNGGEREAGTPRKPKSRRETRLRRRFNWFAAILLLVVLANLPWWPGMGVRKAVDHFWPRFSSAPLEYTLRDARWGRVVLAEGSIGASGAPLGGWERAEVTFATSEVLGREIGALTVDRPWLLTEWSKAGPQIALLDHLEPSEEDSQSGVGAALELRRMPFETLQVNDLRLAPHEGLHPMWRPSAEIPGLMANLRLSRSAETGAVLDLVGRLGLPEVEAEFDVTGVFDQFSTEEISGSVGIAGSVNGAAANVEFGLEWRKPMIARITLPVSSYLEALPDLCLTPARDLQVNLLGISSDVAESGGFELAFNGGSGERWLRWENGAGEVTGGVSVAVSGVYSGGGVQATASFKARDVSARFAVDDELAVLAEMPALELGAAFASSSNAVSAAAVLSGSLGVEAGEWFRMPTGEVNLAGLWDPLTGFRLDGHGSLPAFEALGLEGVVALEALSFDGGGGVSLEAGVALKDSAIAPRLAVELRTRASEERGAGWEARFDAPLCDFGEGDALHGVVQRYLPPEVGSIGIIGRLGATLNLRGRFGREPSVALQAQASNVAVRASAWQIDGLTGVVDLALRQGRLRSSGEQTMRFSGARAGEMAFGAGYLTWELSRDVLRIANAEMEWLGGTVQAYALQFDLKKHDSKFVLYADDIQVGQLMALFSPLQGTGEGRLYGRMPVQMENGRWKLTTAYLFSMPGQEGIIKLADTGSLLGWLAQAGIPKETRTSLADALRDFAFTTFALELRPEGDGDEALLAVRLQGVSRDPKKPTPVNATINLRGQLEKLLNMGVALGKEFK